ncbi:hypothetical protein AB4Z46_24155 [Variovorax sp. M-6]|uniref:hypothetical protein n=1 Tax=Variovorax sp. M-6 TaxID=3233041 RepID=UPI003F9A2BB3
MAGEYEDAATNELQVGLLLKAGKEEDAVRLRITHAFSSSIYVVSYIGPPGARYCRKPHRLRRSEVQASVDAGSWRLQRTALPAEFFQGEALESKSRSKSRILPDEIESDVDAAYRWIKPLVDFFDTEAHLARCHFHTRIKERALELELQWRTILRLLLRYYYFGRVEAGLRHLNPGPTPCSSKVDSHDASESEREPLQATLFPELDLEPQMVERKRRVPPGPQQNIAKSKGPNHFVIDHVVDDQEMVDTVKKVGKDPSTLAKAHWTYLNGPFALRYPKVYAQWQAGQAPLPITYWTFRRSVRDGENYDKDLLDNIPALSSDKKGRSSFVRGPGEVYEVDATGGRIELIAKDVHGDPVCVGKPWIYLLIDRGSKFIVSIYVTLNSLSWEELKQLLLLALSPRASRLRALGIEYDERRWVRGRVPNVIVQDRGSEFLSNNNIEALRRLKIEVVTLPPQTPNGKAVVERVFRTLKQRMASSQLLGTYARRPLDPKSKRQARKAKTYAAESLQDVYRALVEAVDRYNNRVHRALEKHLAVLQHGVPPTPSAIYVWGCDNITGAKVSTLTEDDVRRALLAHGRGSISDGILTFGKHKYYPADREALSLAQDPTMSAHAHAVGRHALRSTHGVDVRSDKTYREEVQVVTNRGRTWSTWAMSELDAQQLRGLTTEEEAAAVERARLLRDETRNDTLIHDSKQPKTPRHPRPKSPPLREDAATTRLHRQEETRKVKGLLDGRLAPDPAKPKRSPRSKPESQRLEEQERAADIARLADALRQG